MQTSEQRPCLLPLTKSPFQSIARSARAHPTRRHSMKANPRRTSSSKPSNKLPGRKHSPTLAQPKKRRPQKLQTQTALAKSLQAKKPQPPQAPQPPKAPLKQRLTQALKQSLSHLLPLAALLSIGGIITGSGLLSAQFILAPKSIAWVNDYLPEALQVPLPEWDLPQTLDDIKKTIQTADRKIGGIIELDNHDRVIPILQNAYNCTSKCDRISELRIYRPAKANGPKRNQPNYRLVAQLDIGAVEDWTISASLAQSENGQSETSDEALPLETYETMDSPETNTGNWFNLTGKRQQGEYGVTYGQLFHYDARTLQLTALTKWSSPSPDRPIVWQQITGSSTPELLIDHSIGLEPRFQAYQVALKGTPDLTLISLTQSASKDSEATGAMKLANVGLWSLAVDRLKRIKSSGGNWGTTAQAQLDLIALHAKLTQDQARQIWANPHQQVLAKLMDGQWQEALKVLEKDPLIQADVRESFKTETSRLWKRLSVAIDDDPSNPVLQAWTAMVMLDRDGTARTKTWLDKQGSSSVRSRALAMLAPALLPPKPKPTPTPELTPAPKAEEKPIVPLPLDPTFPLNASPAPTAKRLTPVPSVSPPVSPPASPPVSPTSRPY